MIIVKTPLRLSFVGGGSDMKDYYSHRDGQVVSTAIDKFVYAIVKERFDDLIYINYSKKECVGAVDEIRHDLVREAMKITGIERGVEITTLADVPSTGSGLGSSSAITVALLHAFYTFQNVLVTAERLALDACRIEIDILKKPIGRQDQYAAAYGGLNHFTFKAGDITRRTPPNIGPPLQRRVNDSLLLYYTGITRSAESILTEQKSNVTLPAKQEIMNRMVALVEPFVAALEQGDMARCGELMDEGWQLKRQMASGISNSHIMKMYETATAAGASAGKIAGAGGGGFLLLMVPRERHGDVFEALKSYRELPFMLENGGSKVIFDDRTYRSK